MNRLDRIESQNIGFGLDGVGRVYRKNGFTSYNRSFLIKRIKGVNIVNTLDKRTGDEILQQQNGFVVNNRSFTYRPYHSNDFASVCRLIYESYIGQPDSTINSQYASYSGCKEFFGNLISNTGCGHFLRGQSLIVEEEGTKRIIGAIITTEISPGNAHLPRSEESRQGSVDIP